MTKYLFLQFKREICSGSSVQEVESLSARKKSVTIAALGALCRLMKNTVTRRNIRKGMKLTDWVNIF